MRSATPGRHGAHARRIRVPRAPTLLLSALLVALAYGVFFHGAAQIPDENRLQVALAVIALVACGAWLLDGSLRVEASRWAWLGFGLMVAFVAWTAISLAWSVAPDGTWTEFNRATAYAVMLGLGLCLGSSHPRGGERLAVGWLVIAVGVALWALSVEGPLAESAIAVRRGNLVAARDKILEAARRQPDSVQVWRQLIGIELARRDAPAAEQALEHALALDPLDQGLLALAPGIVAGLTPPNGSATATGTPLLPKPAPTTAASAPAG